MAASTGTQAVNSKPYLEVTELRKTFSSFEALKGINCSVGRGEFLCLLGPSGCGKTTLLRCIAGLERQSSGEIKQDGLDISNLSVEHRDFGIVFQSYALFPNLSVWDNVSYGIKSKKDNKDADLRNAEQLLEMVRLTGHLNKFPAQLSGGEQQRVALARALATSPGLLLLDEPLSALDAQVRLHLRREIKEIQKRLGVTTIMVTHDQEEAMSMADRVAVMQNGQIEQIGTPSDIYTKPNSEFVAGFIGTMNLFDGNMIDANKILLGDVALECVTDLRGNASNIKFGFRPEKVHLNQNSKKYLTNHLKVKIKDFELRGATTRVFLTSTHFSDEICVDVWTGEECISGLKAGSEINITIPPDSIVILSDKKND
jgi:iron(III) transport system ATP-binding protein